MAFSFSHSKQKALVVSFDTTASAFAFQHHADSYGLSGNLIPVPRVLSAGCGMAWREPTQEDGDAKRLLIERLLKEQEIEYGVVVDMEL